MDIPINALNPHALPGMALWLDNISCECVLDDVVSVDVPEYVSCDLVWVL